jgi:hypothetical protein
MTYSVLFRTATAAGLSLALAAVPAVAKNNSAKVKSTVAKPASAGPKAKAAQAPKAPAPKAAKAQAPKATAQTPKAAGAAKTKSNTKTASAKGSSSKADRSVDSTPASREGLAAPAPAPAPPLSKAQQKLLANDALRSKMEARLPGMKPMVAASGFKNLGQFVAAVNVSNNLGIDFLRLKGLMVNRGMSLGQAIQQAKAMEARRAASLANTAIAQADDEITATSLVSVTATKKGKDKS